MRALFVSLILSVVVLPAVAQESAPRFFIERIEVRNNARVSSEVVIAESRLREGAEYSEGELRDAAARLTRLPFILGADFALERGSERGQHLLIISINETRSFFFSLNGVPLYSSRSDSAQVDDASSLGINQTALAVGYRWFVGRRGALHVAFIGRDGTEFTRGYSAFALGYTQYDIFGTRAFATLNIKSPDGSAASPQLVVGVPLSLNQTVTAEYDVNRLDASTSGRNADMQRVARVTWSYNTTNDPFLPTFGTLLSAGPIAAWRDGAAIFTFVGSGSVSRVRVPIHVRTIGAEAGAIHYVELSDRASVSAGIEGGWARFDERFGDPQLRENSYRAMFGALQLGASYSLWSPERRAMGGDSRVEIVVRGRGRASEREIDGVAIREAVNDDILQASLSWVRHSTWGTVRLGAGYAW